jgi:hypothetical protein
MGSLVSDFPSLPPDADPRRIEQYQRAYGALSHLGLPLPAPAPETVTRAVLLAHLQAQAGAIIKAELAGNPDGVDYAGSDAATAVNIGVAYALLNGQRWPGANLTGYQTAVGTTALGLVVLTNPGLADPLLLGAAFAGLAAGNGLIRFRLVTGTVALRGVIRQIATVPATNQLGLATPLPAVAAVGDVFDIGLVAPPLNICRVSQVLRGFPFAPNALTAADITAAKL